MKIILAILVALSLAGCATNLSSLDDPADKSRSNLIVGDMEAVRSAIAQAIHKTYPNDKITETFDGVFSGSVDHSHTAASLRVEMFGGVGADANKREVKGYFYTVNADATEIWFDPLLQAIKSELASGGLKNVKVSLLKKTAIKDEIAAMAIKAQACFSDLADDPQFAPIKDKISFGTSTDQPFAMLTDNTKPSADEKRAIQLWGKAREGCLALQRKANNAMGIQPQIKVQMDSLITNQQGLIAQLYLGNLTYGEFAQKRQALANTFKEQVSSIMTQQQRAAAESSDRERQIQAMRSAGGPSFRQPVTCSFYGNAMFCN